MNVLQSLCWNRPQGLAYKTARKGVGHFTLHVQGVGAHAGVDFQKGHSAVLEMSKLVQKVSAFSDLERGLTVNAGVISGGTRSNVVAAECFAEVDVRIAKASDAKRVERMFYALKPSDKACKLTVTGGINRPPMERKKGTITLLEHAKRLAQEIGVSLEEAATGGGSDGNFTAALGVPTLDGMGGRRRRGACGARACRGEVPGGADGAAGWDDCDGLNPREELHRWRRWAGP